MHNASHRLAENESEPHLPDPHTDLPATRALIGCVLALLILWTLLGNFTVCAAVLRYRHLRAKVTNIFIVSLALSDLLVALLVMPWKAAAEVAGFWPFGAFCDTWVASDIMCSTASILNLCMISVDRYWAISSPFRYERRMNRRVAFVMVGVTWTVSVVISFVPVQLHWHRAAITGNSGSGDEFTRDVTGFNVSGVYQLHRAAEANGWDCDSSLSRTYAISSSLISFYIPVAIMVVTYTRIYRIAQVQIRRISSLERAAEHAQNCRSDAHVDVDADGHVHAFHRRHHPPLRSKHRCSIFLQTTNSPKRHHHPDLPPPHRSLRYSIRKETKVLKTLSVIMGVFVFCWSPFFILNCAMPFCPGPGTASRTVSDPSSQSSHLYCVSETTFDVFVWFGWSNSSLNPVIYAFNTEFREAFLRLLGCRGDNGCFGGWTTSVTRAESFVLASNEAAGAVTEKKNSLHTMEMGVAYDTSCGAGRGSVTSGVIRDPVRGRVLPAPLTDRRGAVEEPVCDCEVDPVRGRGDSGAGLSRTPPSTLTNCRGTITQSEAVCDCPMEDCKIDVMDRGQRTQMIPSQTF
ncbi:D(1) dopamine receptor-like [Salvelinus fontinalis]|uniref:D(1) dopamine receptor-like n=1 Tax=Salvelinus fontinalis TaxID=8038 RepID=UPI00248578FD|nr:D(1) dopamine receptor-like [Salvelinus fontinalis]